MQDRKSFARDVCSYSQFRKAALNTFVALICAALTATHSFAEDKADTAFKIGTCDWSIKMPLSVQSFQFAQRNGLHGIQYSFDVEGKGLDLRLRENRDTIRKTVRETGVAISSIGIGALNKIPLATTDEAENLVVECLEAMAMLKEEAAALKDRELAAKVSPNIVLLAFFGKADINGKPELIEVVIEKLKRLAPLAEKHGFTLALETLLSEADHRHIMESVGSPAVKVYYDTANSARMGYDIYREIESLGAKNICEIHIKENGDLLGQGDIDFVRIKELLRATQYKGWLIIEGSTPKGMSREEGCEKNATYAINLFN
jgi:L-ribulose-5-phosphate 3-epimerase